MAVEPERVSARPRQASSTSSAFDRRTWRSRMRPCRGLSVHRVNYDVPMMSANIRYLDGDSTGGPVDIRLEK